MSVDYKEKQKKHRRKAFSCMFCRKPFMAKSKVTRNKEGEYEFIPQRRRFTASKIQAICGECTNKGFKLPKPPLTEKQKRKQEKRNAQRKD